MLEHKISKQAVIKSLREAFRPPGEVQFVIKREGWAKRETETQIRRKGEGKGWVESCEWEGPEVIGEVIRGVIGDKEIEWGE